MDQNRPLTKRELKALRRLEKLDRQQQEKSQSTLKRIVFGVAAILFIAFFGFLIFLAKQNSPQKAAVLSDTGWVRGAETAQASLVEFGDFQCPACKAYYPIVKSLLDTYKDKSFSLMFKHFPLTSVHRNAFAAAMAAEAAGAQGKFFEMHDILYEKQDEWAQLPAVEAREKFISYAKELTLDQGKFEKDLDNKELEAKIRSDQKEGIENGVTGTPSFFLNGGKIENPRSIDDFKKIIDQQFE